MFRVFVAYLLFFACFFWGIHSGLGHFWDWSFPYFGDQLSTLFTNKASSWISADMGSPMAYASDYFLRFGIAIFSFLPPELVRYGVLTTVFAAGALGMYLLSRRHTSGWVAFLLGLVAFINPAIFYKYTAGHINYLVAFTFFIYFVYLLLYRFGKDARSAIVAGLLLAAMGVQMQFFIIGALFLVVFFAFNRQLFSWRYAALIIAVPFLIHAVWLSNFATGAISASDTSSSAAQVSVKHSTTSDFLSIFTFSFSKATLLSKFYAFYELLWNAALFIGMLWLLVRQRKYESADVVLLVFFAVAMFMATGLYQAINLGPITGLYPMLREVGHFAPVIVLAALVLLARLVQQSRWRWALTLVLIGSLAIVGIKFQFYSQAFSFAQVRETFTPFKEFADRDQSSYRILAYPFFGKYAFTHLAQTPEGMFPLSNSGHDSFGTFSHQEFIPNAVAPHEFQESVQYQLLQSYDVDVLRPYNIKYIFDFSHIYESNYERYVPATVYNNDRNLIKNDSQFFKKLLARNPGKLRRVNDRILEIRDPLPRVQATDQLFTIPDTQAATASTFTRRAMDNRPLDYLLPDSRLQPYTTNLTPLFTHPTKTSMDTRTGRFAQTITGGGKIYANTSHAMLSYELHSGQLTIFAEPAGQLLLNNQAIQTGSEGRLPVLQIPLAGGHRYYLSFKGAVLPVEQGGIRQLGTGKEGDTVGVYAATEENLLPDSSFEQALWQREVSDCNKYDGAGKLDMERTTQTASDGAAALELRATRHNACTSTKVGLQASTDYLLQFDYQSPNAQTANFFVSYGSDDVSFAKGFRAITDTAWHTATKLITTPDKTGDARLFLYALEQDGKQATVNRYDNVSMVPLQKIQEHTLPAATNPYREIARIAPGKQTLSFQEDSYKYRNVIANPSFEQGPWQRTVSDCNKYDDRAAIGMDIEQGKASKGTHALALHAERHDACVRTTANVTEQSDYLLTFDYQTDAKQYGYAVSFDDPQATVNREQRTARSGGWQRAVIKLRAPARASAMTLYLYAFEEGGKRNTVRYDNVQLIAMPDFADRLYAVQQPLRQLHAPAGITASGSHPAQKDIRITKATAPFFVQLSETYNPRWRLALDTPQLTGLLTRWSPWAQGVNVGTHVPANGYSNGWLVDPQKICQDGAAVRTGCIKHPDGSYDIRLTAEFTPQRWFGLAAAVSWITLAACLTYLALTHRRESPTYQFVHRRLTRQGSRRRS